MFATGEYVIGVSLAFLREARGSKLAAVDDGRVNFFPMAGIVFDTVRKRLL